MLRALLQTIAMSLESLLPLVFLLILVIFIAALVGMEIFGGSSRLYRITPCELLWQMWQRASPGQMLTLLG